MRKLLLTLVILLLPLLAWATNPTVSRTSGLDLMGYSVAPTINTLIKQSGGVAAEATTSDTIGVIGIATALDTGNSRVGYTVDGPASCKFDSGGVTQDHAFGASTSTAGDCTDLGTVSTACSASVQVLGQITSTTASGSGLYTVNVRSGLCH